jgi:hypothetical protein
MEIDKSKDYYAMVCERDGGNGGPVVMGQYLFESDLDSITIRAARLNDSRLVEATIVKLQFDLDQNDIAIRLLGDDSKIDELLDSLQDAATYAGPCEFGLPIHNDGDKELLRKAVLKWVAGL